MITRLRVAAPLAILTLYACGGEGWTTGPPAPPPPPPDLLATGNWVGDYVPIQEGFSTGEFFRLSIVLTDRGGDVGGTCTFEILGNPQSVQTCDVRGSRHGDHQSGKVDLLFSFSTLAGNFSGTLKPGLMSGALTFFQLDSGYEFRPGS